MDKKKPNILFIISDQHNAKFLGYEDHPDVKTQNIDKLAAKGVVFDNAITQNPICTPSRVSFISGQYCHNHGYYGLSGPNPGGLPGIFGLFRDAGYKTSAVGKVHCPEYWVEDQCDNFHETNLFYHSIGGRSPKYAAFLRERGKEALEDHLRLPEFGDKGVCSLDARASFLEYEETQEGWITRETIRFMDECVSQGKPFFANASFPLSHPCHTPAKRFWDMYDEDSLTLPPNADHDMEGKAPHMKKSADFWRKADWVLFEPKTFDAGRLRKLHGYLAAVTQVDHSIGLMLDFLKEKGIDDNTIVIYTADHGEYACEFGIMEKAPGICSDSITRIPYIWQ